MTKGKQQAIFQCECGDHCFMRAGPGYVTLFDPEDIPIVSKGYLWIRKINKHTVYVIQRRFVGIGKLKNFRLHRLIMKVPADIQIDHRSGNALDNRKRNLRAATHSQNQRNKHPRENCSSKYMGVSKCGNKWKAVIQSNKVAFTIGRFPTEVEAAIAYDQHAINLHGAFARLNFPNKKAAAP